MVTPKVQQDSFVVYSMIQTMVYLFKNTKQKIKALRSSFTTHYYLSPFTSARLTLAYYRFAVKWLRDIIDLHVKPCEQALTELAKFISTDPIFRARNL